MRGLTRRLQRGDRVVIAAIAIGALLIATPGVHLFELWMPAPGATIVSHGLALCGLGVAAWQWRTRRADASTAITTLLLPGLSNSGPEHWQSHWERADASCHRVQQTDWETPRCADWVATLDRAIEATAGPVVLVAHSSSCALVAHWVHGAAAARVAQVRGALLVAPSDPEGPSYPHGPTGFAPVPLRRLPFPSIVVASTDDAYVTPARAREYASAWGSEYVEIGAAGHINSASGLGAWPAGLALLERLRNAPRFAT